jgi:hypothetical protein
VARPRSEFFRITLNGWKSHPSARRHGVPDLDVSHAYEHVVAWTQLGEDPPSFSLQGGIEPGTLLEMVVLDLPEDVLGMHVMAL